ncbi:N-acetyltransferase [Paenarthrobacter sp. S56]|uniref:N-acetyltransferase n=1 Tax=Paenarthrobacter sp. S56 TaxID=3138179 RepID=UPI00321AFEEF
MAGETDLDTLLESMHPMVRDGDYVYALWPHGKPLEGDIEAAVREAEGLTVVLRREEADKLGLSYDFVAAWITLQIHSALEAVGLTAAVSAALTHVGISCNVLAGFHHDHLLVPAADSGRALEILNLLGRGIVLRSEQPQDRPDILELTARAFSVSPVTGQPVKGEPVEVKLLRELFDSAEYIPGFSIVAEIGGDIVGHVISTRAWAGDDPLLGLGPIGVAPTLQRRGIGSALMKETAARAAAAGERGIALLGSPAYYARFGYVPAASLGVLPPEAAWGSHFQLLALPGWRDGVKGTFRYAAPFERL